MTAAIRKWLGWLAGISFGAVALFLGWRATRRSRRHDKLKRKAGRLARDKAGSVKKAEVANEEAKAEFHKANAILAKARAYTVRTEDKDEDVAARVRARNRRLRQRRSARTK